MGGDRPPVTLEVVDGVGTLTLRRPENRNAISGDLMVDLLVDAVTMTRTPPMSALVVTGEGSAFSAGGDLDDMRARTGLFSGGSGDEISERYRSSIQQLPKAFARTDVVTIAAVNGPAVGAGFDLALMCDLRYACDTAWFAASFVNLGLVSGDGGTWFMTRALAWQRAAELLLTGRKLSASEAKQYGLVLDVLPAEELLSHAHGVAREIAGKPRHSTRLTKRLLRAAAGESLETFLDLSAAYQALCHGTSDHREALEAYLERRPPAFGGRS